MSTSLRLLLRHAAPLMSRAYNCALLLIRFSVQIADDPADSPYLDHRCCDVIVMGQLAVQLSCEFSDLLLSMAFPDELFELVVSSEEWIAPLSVKLT